jgi:2-deoxy-D-gluconate 3-dehydrogenase
MKKAEFSLHNKVALITGGTGGIGEAVVWAFAYAGAHVFINGTNEKKLKRLSDKLNEEGFESRFMAIDITAPDAPQKLIDEVLGKMGKIDIVVNSAGINRPQKHEDVTEKNWDDIMNINLKAMFFVSQAAGKEMIKGGGGKIINISSQAGIVALPLRAAYCSSKGGVNQLTRTLALEWAKHNVLVNAVAPTFVLTDMTEGMLKDETFKKYVLGNIPLGRMVNPDEVAHAVLFLASDLADMITGHILAVDGGWTIA